MITITVGDLLVIGATVIVTTFVCNVVLALWRRNKIS